MSALTLVLLVAGGGFAAGVALTLAVLAVLGTWDQGYSDR